MSHVAQWLRLWANALEVPGSILDQAFCAFFHLRNAFCLVQWLRLWANALEVPGSILDQAFCAFFHLRNAFCL